MSLLSAAQVWVCKSRQADYQGICAPATLQFLSAENRGCSEQIATMKLVCSPVHLCNNFSRQQSCVSCITTKDYDGDAPECSQFRVASGNFVQSLIAGRCRKSSRHAASVRTSNQWSKYGTHRSERRHFFQQTIQGRESPNRRAKCFKSSWEF